MIEKFDPTKEYAIGQEVEINGHVCTVEEDTTWCGTHEEYCVMVDGDPKICQQTKCSKKSRSDNTSVCFIRKVTV